jgi:sensor histidine kinase regulating citrate/malate metabolism
MLGDKAPLRWRVVTDVAIVLSVAAFALTALLFYERIHDSRKSQADTNQAIRTVLCYAQQQSEADPLRTQQQRARAVRFYTEALKKINELPCPRIQPGGKR